MTAMPIAMMTFALVCAITSVSFAMQRVWAETQFSGYARSLAHSQETLLGTSYGS